MNILREIRKVNQKSMPIRIISILAFSLILIINTYAWFTAQKDINIGGLQGDVTSWDVSYFANTETNPKLDEVATFTIDQFYPGMPEREDIIHIYNMGETETSIQYELISVKVFGQEILSQLRTNGEITTDTATNTTHIFAKNTEYPFDITYTYDKTSLEGNENFQDYVTENGYTWAIEKGGVTVTPPTATLKFTVNWAYDVVGGTDAQNAAKDILDTKFGKDAYEYYEDENNDPTKAVEIKVRITSNMVHPMS